MEGNIKFQQIKKVIFCLSYLEIPWTMQIIQASDQETTLLITNIDNIIKQITDIYPNINIFSTKDIILPTIHKNIFKTIVEIRRLQKEKRQYEKYFASLEHADVFFFFVGFGIFESWLILFLSKKNKIYYRAAVEIRKTKSTTINIEDIDNAIYYILFGKIIFEKYKIGRKRYHAVSKQFLRKIRAMEFPIPSNQSMVKDHIRRTYYIARGTILYLGSDSIIDETDYIYYNDILLKYLIEKYGINRIVFKNHPSRNKKYSVENELIEIPNYLAGNLICDQFDIIIGTTSALLYEAANRDILTISTIDYFLKNDGYGRKIKEYLSANLNKGKYIKYFQTISELEEILNNENNKIYH